MPLALRGRADVTSYAPSALPQAPDDLLVRVSQLYAGDAQLHALWSAAMEARGLAADAGARQDPASLGKLAASFPRTRRWSTRRDDRNRRLGYAQRAESAACRRN